MSRLQGSILKDIWLRNKGWTRVPGRQPVPGRPDYEYRDYLAPFQVLRTALAIEAQRTREDEVREILES